MVERIRLGILCDGTTFPMWQAESIRQALAVDGVDLVVLVMRERKQAAPAPWHQRLRMYPWRIGLFLWWRRNRFKPASAEPMDLERDLAAVPRIPCTVIAKGPVHRFKPEDIDRIAEYRPDVLLRFGFGILKGPILDVPRFGVWSYHHGDEELYRGQPPGFWEIMDGSPVIGAILQRLTEQLDAGHVLRKGWFRTVDHSLSATLDSVTMGSAGWVAQACTALLLGTGQEAQGLRSATKAPIRKYPGNLDTLRFLLKLRGNATRREEAHKRTREERNIGVLYQPIGSLLGSDPNLNIRWLPAPGLGQSRACPFGYMADGQLNVLYTKHDHGTGKSEISRLRPKRDNILKRSRTMLVGGGGVSYPFIVDTSDAVYVVPQDSSTNRVDLYRVNSTNEALEHVRTILNEPLCSPTLFEHGGRWWLMGTKEPWADVALYAYHAEQLTGPFIPHALNPLKMDLRSARPAGTPFLHNGKRFRPVLDTSHTSGDRVALMHVTALTPDTFSEEVVRTIGPIRGSVWSKGLLTISAQGEITLVEGLRHVPAGKQNSSTRRATKKKNRADRDLEDADDDD